MPCIPIPTATVPTLPAPLSIAAPPPPSVGTPGLCCQLVPPFSFTPPLAIAVLNPAVVLTINQALHAVQEFIDKLPPRCPRSS